MSDEYQVKFARDALPDISKLALSVRQSVGYELVGVASDAVHGAYSGSSPQANWPEDFTLLLKGPMNLLTVHGGTSAQRQQLLVDLRAWLGDQGLQCVFEEL